MRSLLRSRRAPWLVLAVVLPHGLMAQVQGKFPPDSLINLKVLPQDIPIRRLIDLMRGFTGALGVRCQFCHVGKEGMPLDSFDFASDQKRTKKTARLMLRMVARINDSSLIRIPERPTPAVEVTCFTCHRGIHRPRPLEDELRLALDSAGLDSARNAYRQLRQRYYGSATYDFSEGTITGLAVDLARARRWPDALGMLDLNGEFFPQSPAVPGTRGDVYLASGDTAAAIAAYRDALALDSTYRPARFRLRRLEGGRRP